MTKMTRRSDKEASATIVETPQARSIDRAAIRDLPVEAKWGTPVKVLKASERTDDSFRLYLREIGSVDLLSREGEVALAKRIEAGRRAMIAGLCECPLTFQTIVIGWALRLVRSSVGSDSPRPASSASRSMMSRRKILTSVRRLGNFYAVQPAGDVQYTADRRAQTFVQPKSPRLKTGCG